MAKEQDLVFKVKSVDQAKSLNKIVQDLSDDIVKEDLSNIKSLSSTVKQSPSGDCYRLAAKEGLSKGGNVVHGIITNVEGKTFGHAWVERGDVVFDPSTKVTIPKNKYYELLDAKPEAQYPEDAAALKAIKTGHWGPWHAIKAVGKALGKDALGVSGLIPLDTRAMNEESQFKMVRQILGNLGLKNVPKPI